MQTPIEESVLLKIADTLLPLFNHKKKKKTSH